MGNHSYEQAAADKNVDDDFIAAEAAKDPRLQELLADPATRQQTIRRIQQRRERLAAQHAEPEKVEAPWAAEVNGVPTGSTVHYDDDHAITTETTEKKGKTVYEKKPDQKLSDATVGRQTTTTTTVSDGENKDVHETTKKATVNKKDGLTLGGSSSHESSVGEDASTKTTRSGSASANLHGGKIGGGTETEVKLGGDNVAKKGHDGSISLDHGKVSGEYAHKTSIETKEASHERSQGVSIESDKIKFSAGKGDYKKITDEDGKERKVGSGHDGSISIGKEGVAGDYSHSKSNADGSSSKTSVGAEIGEDKVKLEASHSHTFKNGVGVKAGANVGDELHADDPVKEGNQWVVHYTHTKTVGGSAGGSYKGGAISGGAKHEVVDSGTRSFKTEDEAKDFKKHIAERVKEGDDPMSAKGAMEMAVGETRGHDSSNSANVGGSVSFQGATGSVSAHKKSDEGVEIKRVSDKLFEVTVQHDSEHGHDFGASGNLVTLNQGSSAGTNDGITVQFDLSTADGKAAYEQFCKDHKVPAHGGKVVSQEDGLRKEHHDGAAILGNSQSWQHATGQNTVTDEQGKHEKYWGKDSNDNTTGWIGHHITGDKDQHSSTEVIARQENDKNAGYTLIGKTSGESGKYNRGKLQHLMGRDENWDESKVKPSGEWTMSADIDEKTMKSMVKYSNHFKGTQGDNDKQMQALSEWVSEDGMDAVNSIEQWSGHQLAWDLELKGDPNFPGRAGRESIDARIQQYAAALAAAGSGAPAIVAAVNGEIAMLEVRRAAVANKTKYTDLPDGLRAAQLQLIDKEIAGFESVRHRGLLESVKNKPGEDIGHIVNREADKHGYDKYTGVEKQIAEVRDQIASQDGFIAGAQKESMEAEAAVREAVRHLHIGNNGKLYNVAARASVEAKNRDQQERAAYLKLDDLRLKFTQAQGNEALALGQQLLSQLQAHTQAATEAQEKWYECARAQVLITSDAGLAPHADFWQRVRETMETEDFMQDESFSAGLTPDSDDDDDKTPVKKTAMALPESRKRHGHG